jgi:hypothetical protein
MEKMVDPSTLQKLKRKQAPRAEMAAARHRQARAQAKTRTATTTDSGN